MQNGDVGVARQLLEGVRSFTEREVPQYLADHREEEYPEPLVKRLRELGVFGANVPARYDGLGCGEDTTAQLLYLLARGWQSLASLAGTHLKLCSQMLRHGTCEQRSTWLPAMASGAAIFARAYHEQGRCDPELLETHVRDSAGHRTLHGRKDWVTNARHADRILALVRDGQVTLGVLVDPSADGVEIGPELSRPGVLGVSLCAVTFDGYVFDPEREVLGGSGHDLTDSLRAGDLRGYTARAVACADAVCDCAVRFAARTIGHRPPDAQGAIRLRVGEVRARTAAIRAIWSDLSGPSPAVGPDEAKVICTALLQEIVQACVLLCGGAGYADPHDSLGRHYRDALALPIVGASNDVLLSRIGSVALTSEEGRRMEIFREDASVVLRYAEHVNGVEETVLRRVSQREGARVVRLPPFQGVDLDVLDLSTLSHTGTFKDWVACVATARALQAGTPTVAAQSSGNTANALASYASHVGIRSVVLYPPDSRRRLLPSLAAHPLVDFIEVDASEQRIKQILREAAQAANVPVLPSLSDQYEGNKLRAHLLRDAAGELGHGWDWHVQALSSAYGPLGFYRGVDELGCAPGPRLLGVQQEAVAPYAEALEGVDSNPSALMLEPTLFRRVLTPDLLREVRKLCADTAGTVRVLSNRRYLSGQQRAVRLLEDAGIRVTLSPSGEPRERAGLYALCGALAAVEDGLVPEGQRVLVVYTGGSGPETDLFTPKHTAAEKDAVSLMTTLLTQAEEVCALPTPQRGSTELTQ